MTITNGLATLAEFKAWVQVRGGSTTTDTGDDAVIEDIIEQASRYIEEQTGRRFWKNTNDETRYFEPQTSTSCEIDDLSAAPTSVAVDYSEARTYTTLASTDYELLPDNALLDGKPYTEIVIAPQITEYFPTIRKGVKIVAKFGFPSVPENIKNACLQIAHSVWMSRSGQSSFGRVTMTAAGVVIRPEDVPAMAQADILVYRKYR